MLDAYALPQDDATLAARERLQAGGLPQADALCERLDWSPEEVWGPAAGHPSSMPTRG